VSIPSLETPEHAGSREQAIDLASALADDLTGQIVVLDFSGIVVSTPSFLDELIKQILERRHASALNVVGATDRARHLLIRAATNREVLDRLDVAVRAA